MLSGSQGFSGLIEPIKAFHTLVIPAVQTIFREAKLGCNVTVNFIGPNDGGIAAWLRQQIDSRIFDGRSLVVDFHDYLNWDGQVRVQIIRHARTHSVGKYQSCMFYR